MDCVAAGCSESEQCAILDTFKAVSETHGQLWKTDKFGDPRLPVIAMRIPENVRLSVVGPLAREAEGFLGQQKVFLDNKTGMRLQAGIHYSLAWSWTRGSDRLAQFNLRNYTNGINQHLNRNDLFLRKNIP
jgi:hypothetical protein